MTGWRWARVLKCQVTPVQAGAYYDLTLTLQLMGAVAENTILALLSARDDSTGTTTMPDGWTEIVRYFPTDASSGADSGLLLATGPATEDVPITFQHGSTFTELIGAQIAGIDVAGMGTPATDLDPGTDVNMSIDVVAGGPGIVMVGIRVNDGDGSGEVFDSYPDGWVEIFERNVTGGSGERDWGMVLWGYVPVDSAGTYTMSFTKSTIGFFLHHKVLVGVWFPTTGDVEVLQTAYGGEQFSSFPTMTFDDPL